MSMQTVVTLVVAAILALVGVIGAVKYMGSGSPRHPVVMMPNGVAMPHHLMAPTGTGETTP
jgi:hypothetical protein